MNRNLKSLESPKHGPGDPRDYESEYNLTK